VIALLSGHSLTVKSRFPAEKFALNLSERQSTATITVGPQAPAVSVDDWLRDEDDPGAGIVWRVKSVDYSYETDTRTLNCEHVINTLKDRLMFGEVTAATITGNKKATTCTCGQAIRYILNNYQSDWVLGDLTYGKSAAYSFNGDDLFSAIETVSSSLSDPWWSYDLTVYPFKLNITDRESSVGCEMRMDRNIRTLRRTIDRSRMFTRFYPIGENDLHISGSYVQKNTDLYGVVCKVETDTSKKTEADLKAWANDRLNRHCEPAVTVTISGLDLSAATKESLDNIRLGLKCRVPLPEYETTIEEWVTKLSWSDKIADRESVTVTLANALEDVASIVNSLSKTTSSGGRAAAKKAGEDHAWFVDTDTHVGMVAEAVAGPGADEDWSRVSSIFVDGEGIHQKVTKTQGDLVVAEARIEVNENSIKQEVSARKSADAGLSSRIEQTADTISMVVEGTGKNAYIKPAMIQAGINHATGKSKITLSADHIVLDGAAVASSLQSQAIRVQSLQVDGEFECEESVTAPSIDGQVGDFDDLTCGSLDVYDGNTPRTATWKSKSVITGVTTSNTRQFVYAVNGNLDNLSKITGALVTDTDSDTIYYLGR